VAGADGFEDPALLVSLGLFALSIPIWFVAIARGAVRTTRGEHVDVPGLFFLAGSAPKRIVVHLFGSLTVAVAVAVAMVAASRDAEQRRLAFGFLEPMLALGLIGLWGARHGTFPPRPEPARRRVTDPKAKRPLPSPDGPGTGGRRRGPGPNDPPGTERTPGGTAADPSGAAATATEPREPDVADGNGGP
jgi:hypothetical protein